MSIVIYVIVYVAVSICLMIIAAGADVDASDQDVFTYSMLWPIWLALVAYACTILPFYFLFHFSGVYLMKFARWVASKF